MAMRPGSDIRASRAADVYHGVVNGVADGADIFFGGASRGAHDAGFYERNAERGKNQNKTDEKTERNNVANRRKPGRADGADQEVSHREDEIRKRKSAAKPKLVRHSAAKDGEKPDHAAEDAGERSGLLGGEVELLLEIDGEGGKGAIVGEALEDLADVGDPEGALEAVANFLEPLAKAHGTSAGCAAG
jgi:hypothetical protein